MTIVATIDDLAEIKIMPETTADEIGQTVMTIAATTKGSVPLMRDMGMERSYLQRPMAAAKVAFEQELTEQIEQYEPRAAVSSVTALGDEFIGALFPRVEVEIDE